MKSLSALLITVAMTTLLAAASMADTAELQVIHNAADPGAAVVDVYVNGDRLLDDFAFRTATPFVEVPAGVNLNIGVAPPDSDSADEVIADFDVTLMHNQRYVAVANGVLNPNDFAPNPDGMEIGFNLYAQDGVRKSGPRWGVKLIAFHGATDAPAVDILTQTNWGSYRVIDDLGYGEFSGYRLLRPKRYVLDVTPAGDNDTVVASFEADLRGLGGGAAVVFASGFLSPGDNQNGAAFGLFAALPDGQVVTLPAVAETAQLQVIHNAADPLAAAVDVYVNDELLLDDFAFRAATPFVEVPANVNLNIGVAPGDSESADDVIADFDVTLETGNRYVAMANGVLNPDDFAENPDDLEIGFNLFARDNISESTSWWLVKLYAFHGATDAPSVDILRDGLWGTWNLFTDLSYGEFGHPRYVLPRRYTLYVTPAGADEVVAAFAADLRGLGGGVAVVFASGFLSPDDNQNGAAFGLFAALGDGTVVELPAVNDRGDGIFADRQDEDAAAAASFALGQNFPNPFNPRTTIAFNLPEAGHVSLKIYDTQGRVIKNLVDDQMGAGEHQVTLNADNMASGVYFYRLQASGKVETRRMTLLR